MQDKGATTKCNTFCNTVALFSRQPAVPVELQHVVQSVVHVLQKILQIQEKPRNHAII